MAQADYLHREELKHLLAALMPANRLALEISLATGLRISDVLGIKSEQVRNSADGRLTVRELKTGKSRRVKLPAELLKRALILSGKVYVFEHRYDWKRHRTRQAVYKDLKRIARAFRCRVNVSSHTARKSYAVEAFKRTGELSRVQKLLNHSSEAVTVLYAFADELTKRRLSVRSCP
jgi:integrase